MGVLFSTLDFFWEEEEVGVSIDSCKKGFGIGVFVRAD